MVTMILRTTRWMTGRACVLTGCGVAVRSETVAGFGDNPSRTEGVKKASAPMSQAPARTHAFDGCPWPDADEFPTASLFVPIATLPLPLVVTLVLA